MSAQQKNSVVRVARCPEHGLHGCRDTCFECGGPVEQVPMVEVATGSPGLEDRLRYAGARVHEGRETDITALADLCIEAADHLVRSRPASAIYISEGTACPDCGVTRCRHDRGCHVCKACR